LYNESNFNQQSFNVDGSKATAQKTDNRVRSHIGENIPLKRYVIPIDYANTKFLAHYDICADDINGIKPNDGSIYTLRPKEGKYGGCIAVEEGTTNMLPSNQQSFETGNAFGSWATSDPTDTVDNTTGWIGTKSMKIVSTGTSVIGSWLAPNTAVTAGQTYTFSCYTKENPIINKTAYVLLSWRNSSDSLISASTGIAVSASADWRRLSVTGTAPTGAVAVYCYIYLDGTIAVGDTQWIDGCQLENKSFATSYTNSNRAVGQIIHSLNLINNISGTISMWFNPAIVQTSGYPMLMRQGNSIYEWYFRNNMMHMNGTQIATSKNIIANQWYFTAYTWDNINNKQVLYLFHPDGTIDTSISNTATPAFSANTYFSIGSSYDSTTSYVSNSRIDELRIDKRAASQEEIKAWYISQAPFYPRGIQRQIL
jgi:hypothetical protein